MRQSHKPSGPSSEPIAAHQARPEFALKSCRSSDRQQAVMGSAMDIDVVGSGRVRLHSSARVALANPRRPTGADLAFPGARGDRPDNFAEARQFDAALFITNCMSRISCDAWRRLPRSPCRRTPREDSNPQESPRSIAAFSLNRDRSAEDCPRTARPRYSRCLIESNELFAGYAHSCPAVSRCPVRTAAPPRPQSG
jgi:hypothetical protein